MPAPFSHDLFLSYCSRDREQVQRLVKRLSDAGLRVWQDEFEISPGTAIPRALTEALDKSRILLACLSPASLSSSWVNFELNSAIMRDPQNQTGRFLFVLLQDCEIPSALRQFEHIDWRSESDSEFEKLVVACREDNRIPAPHLPPTNPPSGLEMLVPRRSIKIADARLQFIPGDVFPMGSDDGHPHERPSHPVQVSPFFLSEAPVTNREFARFVSETSHFTAAEESGVSLCRRGGEWMILAGASWSHPAGPESNLENKESHPVVHVGWNDAFAYCGWLRRQTGFHFTLPTEAQWEYAAAGTAGWRWPTGNSPSPRSANLEGTGTAPVGRYLPNLFGLFDMAGNVYEWCLDRYASDWSAAGHGKSPVLDPAGPTAGDEHVLRGGSWSDVEYDCRCANRLHARASLTAANWGFRCCLVIDDALIATLLHRGWEMPIQEMLPLK